MYQQFCIHILFTGIQTWNVFPPILFSFPANAFFSWHPRQLLSRLPISYSSLLPSFTIAIFLLMASFLSIRKDQLFPHWKQISTQLLLYPSLLSTILGLISPNLDTQVINASFLITNTLIVGVKKWPKQLMTFSPTKNQILRQLRPILHLHPSQLPTSIHQYSPSLISREKSYPVPITSSQQYCSSPNYPKPNTHPNRNSTHTSPTPHIPTIKPLHQNVPESRARCPTHRHSRPKFIIGWQNLRNQPPSAWK